MAYLRSNTYMYLPTHKRLIINIKNYSLFINFLNHINNHYDNIRWVYSDNLYPSATIKSVKYHNDRIYVHFLERLSWGAGFRIENDAVSIIWSIDDYVPIDNFEKELLEYRGYSKNASLIDEAVHNNFNVWQT